MPAEVGPSDPAVHARDRDDPLVRVGVDLAAVADVEASICRFGDRYLRRVFTDHELATCEGLQGWRVESLAARFAAKEAVIKVLRPFGPRPDWREIEVRRRDDGSCDVHLTGAAEASAAEEGLGRLSVSLSHEAGLGVAVVVGLCTGRQAVTAVEGPATTAGCDEEAESAGVPEPAGQEQPKADDRRGWA